MMKICTGEQLGSMKTGPTGLEKTIEELQKLKRLTLQSLHLRGRKADTEGHHLAMYANSGSNSLDSS